ncbi:hypothetical protein [Pseudomonas donghuensis]|uniref:Uncharacterized protein n=1 Tax=Pseudomonas donghuensis TaxID=1163398 RepID=A0AAQ0IS63_9PSED|nr:hypothetical protein [Pseudomonas donghuensis]MDF9893446.1 hypothetical protein [Pseudomonas vranovensis]QWE81278.1 hypothetical protein BV82_13310 [Pseudomonas donghuensis]
MEIDENAPGNRSQQVVTRATDNETGHDPRREESEVPLPPDDEAPVEEELSDVEANNSVSSEHPESGSGGTPGVDPQMNDQGDDAKEPRGVPASDPESGA